MSIETRATAREAVDDPDDAPQLLLDADRVGAGAGGLAADVEDRRALGREPAAVVDGLRGVVERAAVREGVGRDVDHAHDLVGHPLNATGRLREEDPGGR